MFVQRLLKKFGDEPIDDVRIGMLNASTAVANELFAAILSRDTPETGYKRFSLEGFASKIDALEESLIEDVLKKLSDVKIMEFKTGCSMSYSAREQLVNLMADAIEQHESQDMTWLDFWMMRRGNVTPADTRLAQALSNFGSTQLEFFGLGGNFLYWEEPTVKAELMDYIKRQTSLSK